MSTAPVPQSATVRKNFDAADETRTASKTKVEVVDLGAVTAMRGTFEPGWKWSECVKPVAGTESCQVAHTGYVASGRMMIRMDDGTEHEFGPGDVGTIPPGHDAWVVGDDACVFIDFQGGEIYAKPQG
jgi:uncharacterized cupin superfamily protein